MPLAIGNNDTAFSLERQSAGILSAFSRGTEMSTDSLVTVVPAPALTVSLERPSRH
jgi:hypothetical protein